jgi:hypothetical protein
MKKIWLILIAVILATGFVFTGCASSGGSGGGAKAAADAVDPTTVKFRHFLGIYIQENWNATNGNEAPLEDILEFTYSFVGGRKTADYVNYFILEKREQGPASPLKIKSITITADGEAIPLDLQNGVATKAAWSAAPAAPADYADGVLTVDFLSRFIIFEFMPRLAVEIPEGKRAAIANAGTVSVKIELDK